MDTVEKIAIRRATLDWRDKWLARVPDQLEREILALDSSLDRQIDRIQITELFQADKFIAKNLEPVIEIWIGNETRALMRKARKELKQANEEILHIDIDNLGSSGNSNTDSYLDAALGVLSTGGAIAAIPTVMTLSVSSTGGILAALGFGTTLAVNWPVALIGVTFVGGMLAFGGNRVFGIKDRKTKKLKEEMRLRTRELVFGLNGSVCIVSKLQDSIRVTANSLLEAVPND